MIAPLDGQLSIEVELGSGVCDHRTVELLYRPLRPGEPGALEHVRCVSCGTGLVVPVSRPVGRFSVADSAAEGES